MSVMIVTSVGEIVVDLYTDKMPINCQEFLETLQMDNVLIDDRRIHVDFSQSVAKLWSQYRRKNTQKGGGCFKCGSPDHLAKDCTGSPSAKQQPAKYIFKDDTRNGGDDNSRYEMVFDEGTGGSPERSKRRRHNELDDHSEKRSTNREGLDEFKGREYRNRDSGNRQREHGRSKEYRRDDRHMSPRKSPSGGQRKEYSRRDDHDFRRNMGGDRYEGRRDDRDHKRSTDSSSHVQMMAGTATGMSHIV